MLEGTGGRRRRGWQRMRWLDGTSGRESEWNPGVGDGQGGLACCDSWGRKESDTTERLNWTKLKLILIFSIVTFQTNGHTLGIRSCCLSQSFLSVVWTEICQRQSSYNRAWFGIISHPCLKIICFYRLIFSVPSKFVFWDLNPQCDGMKSWGLWEVIRSWAWIPHGKSKRVPEKHLFLLYWLCQILWLCGSQ